MTPPRQRKSGPAQAPLIQDRPAEQFPPNPTAPVKAPPEQASERVLRVTGPKNVGGVEPGGRVVIELTDAQYEALRFGGHVEPWKDNEPVTGTEEGN